MDTTTLSVLGVDDAELTRLLCEAGAPHDEVPRLLRRLRMYFLQGGSVDALLGDTSILETTKSNFRRFSLVARRR